MSYREFFVDPNLRRPYTFFEEQLLNFAHNRKVKNCCDDFVSTDVLGMHWRWPKWFFYFVAKNLLKAGYILRVGYNADDSITYKLSNEANKVLEDKKAREYNDE